MAKKTATKTLYRCLVGHVVVVTSLEYSRVIGRGQFVDLDERIGEKHTLRDFEKAEWFEEVGAKEAKAVEAEEAAGREAAEAAIREAEEATR